MQDMQCQLECQCLKLLYRLSVGFPWLISSWLCRILKAVKERLESTAAEREAKRNIKVEGAGNVPKTMQVKPSPVSANGSGEQE